jgi:putative transposase
VIIDIYSRYVVGWLIAESESAVLAEKLLADTIAKHDIDRDQLTIHADNGSSMASTPVAFLLADLGVTKTHSRPHTSNDNPYSESHFRTLKYRPDFPTSFGSLEDARARCQHFFSWYNTEHYHSNIAWHHPVNVHYGHAERCRQPAPTSSPPPTRATPNGSYANTPNHQPYPTPPGSTNPPTTTNSTSSQLTQRIPNQPASKS